MNWKTPITLLVLLAVLLGGAWYGWTNVFGGGSGPSSAEATADSGCLQKTVYAKGTVIRARSITVNVYNAGNRSGLADQTLEKLDKHGFMTGETGNGSTDGKVTNVVVVSGAKKDPKARLVARQFEGKVKIRTGAVTGDASTINVYVGDGFKKLDKQAPKKLKIKKPVEVCQIG